MRPNLVWKRDPILDTYSSETLGHTFISMRTWCDVAVLYHNGIEIRRSASDGSHKNNISFANDVFAKLQEKINAV